MTSLKLRPRFTIESNLSPGELTQKIRAYLQNSNLENEATIAANHVVLKVPKDQAHFWSPQLNLDISVKKEGSFIRGLFGPNPAVWTMFMFLYMGIATIGLFGLMFGLSQWTINKEPTALWTVPITLLTELIIYLVAQSGKKLGSKQMDQLNSIFNEILNHSSEQEREKSKGI